GRGRAGQRHHALADDPQGPAPDVEGVAGAGHQPGPALRALDGGHRRHGRRRQPRLHRGLRLQPGPAVRQGSVCRHRDRGARRDARSHRAVRRGPGRAVATLGNKRLLRGGRGAEWKGNSIMGRGSARTRLMALAAVLGLGLTACGGGGISDTNASGSSDCGDLRIAVNPWTGYVANAHVIGQLAKEKLGCNVTYPEVKEEGGWQGMADGSIDTVVENWGHEDLVKKYITDQHVVEDAGKTGNEGLIGWFVPQWMADKYPDILDWHNLNKYASMFKTSESGDKGQLLDGD